MGIHGIVSPNVIVVLCPSCSTEHMVTPPIRNWQRFDVHWCDAMFAHSRNELEIRCKSCGRCFHVRFV